MRSRLRPRPPPSAPPPSPPPTQAPVPACARRPHLAAGDVSGARLLCRHLHARLHLLPKGAYCQEPQPCKAARDTKAPAWVCGMLVGVGLWVPWAGGWGGWLLMCTGRRISL